MIYGVINQINSDEKSIKGTGSDEWGIREPTNEEISMLMHTSMAYGAKIMLEFSYTSKKQSDSINAYNWGLTTSDNNFTGKRDTNYYGQHKWDFVADLNYKLKRTGDYMYPMNLPNEHLIHDKTLTVNTVTYPECTECGYTNYDYINEIRSLAPLRNTQNPCVETGITSEYYDCTYERFWELGFFNHNTSSINQYDKSKYLYAVNKRTYPRNPLNNLADVRILKIRFNASNLPGYNNWVIKEAITDSVLAVFNKMDNNFITVASFEPGEGKLLKLAPVMQEGGTFVCDEEVISSTCV